MDRVTFPKHRSLALACAALAGIGLSGSAAAAPFTLTRYVHIDHAAHTAYIYDEQFNRLEDSPFIAGTSVEPLPQDRPLWYLGASVDIVRQLPDGRLDVVSDDPAYYEMNHHFTWIYYSPTREVTDPCGVLMPLAAGSELTDFRLPSGYGFKLDGGFVNGGDWHWANPASIPHDEKVYLRFALLLDDAPDGYRDVNVTWIDALPCESEFAIAPGKSTKAGPPLPADRDARVVAVVPHVHDHARYIELQRNGRTLHRFVPATAPITVAHDDVGGGSTGLHVHRRHLPTEGLSLWTPGINGPLIRRGDTLSAFGSYNNPHRRPIDNMTLFVVFWEPVTDIDVPTPDH